MSTCKTCGVWINWTDPNMHYGGHTCNPDDVARHNAKIGRSKDTTPIDDEKYDIEAEQKKIVQNLTWKDVFDSQKMFPSNWFTILEYLKKTNYRYIAFNGIVYDVKDINMEIPICKEADL